MNAVHGPNLTAGGDDHKGVGLRISAFGDEPRRSCQAGLWRRNSIEMANALPFPLDIIE